MSDYSIPLFNLNFDREEEEAILDVIRSKWISSGPVCQKFEEEFSEALDIPFSVSLSSCTAALHLAMIALDIGPGDEVLVPSLTFVATVNAILYVGATPVFVDITGIDEPNISISDLKSKYTSKTKAVIAVHLAGFPCDLENIVSFCKQNDLRLIEDACHGPLSEYNGKKLGTFGDIGVFSFFSNKNISTGEGGMLVTSSERINDRVKLLRSHGMTTLSYERAKGHSTTYDVVDLGFNYRMDDMRASLGRVQLTKLPDEIRKRAELRRVYIDMLSSIPDVIVPFESFEGVFSNYIFPVVMKNSGKDFRDEVRALMAKNGVQTSVHYPPIHRFQLHSAYSTKPLTNTELYCNSSLTLPMFGSLSHVDIQHVADTLQAAITSSKQ